MTKQEFIKTMEEYLEKTGLSEGAFDSYITVGDKKNVNTTIYVDEHNDVWLTAYGSIIRTKTSINVDNVAEFRYSQWETNAAIFYVICDDNSGLDFCEGDIRFFTDGNCDKGKEAIKWFKENPVK